MTTQFLTLADVAEQLKISPPAVRNMVISGELPAIQVGGRREWRVEQRIFEEYITNQYEVTKQRIAAGELS